MDTRNFKTVIFSGITALALSACGGTPESLVLTQEELAAGGFVESCENLGEVIALPFDGEPSTGGETPPYKKNPGDECTLISKYNGDIDGGFDVSGGSYGDFKQCMQDAGCYNPGFGTSRTPRCDTKLKDCQEHLIGGGPGGSGGLEVERDFDGLTADDWRSFGSGLGG